MKSFFPVAAMSTKPVAPAAGFATSGFTGSPVAARLSTSSTEPFSLNRKLEMIDDDALTTQKLRPSLSKEIQQELVEVFVGPVVIWPLVGISNDIGLRKPKPLSSYVDTEPLWNWLSDAASPSARNSRDSVTTTTSRPCDSRMEIPMAPGRLRSSSLFRFVEGTAEIGNGVKRPGCRMAKLSSFAFAASLEIADDPAL